MSSTPLQSLWILGVHLVFSSGATLGALTLGIAVLFLRAVLVPTSAKFV